MKCQIMAMAAAILSSQAGAHSRRLKNIGCVKHNIETELNGPDRGKWRETGKKVKRKKKFNDRRSLDRVGRVT